MSGVFIENTGIIIGDANELSGCLVLVEANTAGSGAHECSYDFGICSKTLTNEGATAQNYHTLPSAASGLKYTFVVQDSDGILYYGWFWGTR